MNTYTCHEALLKIFSVVPASTKIHTEMQRAANSALTATRAIKYVETRKNCNGFDLHMG